MPLKQTQILSAAPGVHVDGNGLYLSVSRKGAKSWIFRYGLVRGIALVGDEAAIGVG